ncbi:MAG: co-chaperone GroES [Candidatus Dadabacteria bacterium]|nr:co-chaperone GroES [Candidatus Dadabacteria bacterium]NIS07742.1 co-chaperone GroES [Candidatus Dadabacteria bacterium]NIV42347.1 co-chaperone GroES [Candidatus Dadabacteria bacterium]NIY21383.1 co-chaperone GroES [Candidatus Dadabacteria bacterium]
MGTKALHEGFRPLHDKVLAKRIGSEEVTKGGIIIPETAQEKPQEGQVIAVGTGRILPDGTVVPLEVKKGDKILFSKYGGNELNIEGEDYIILEENDILAVLK